MSLIRTSSTTTEAIDLNITSAGQFSVSNPPEQGVIYTNNTAGSITTTYPVSQTWLAGQSLAYNGVIFGATGGQTVLAENSSITVPVFTTLAAPSDIAGTTFTLPSAGKWDVVFTASHLVANGSFFDLAFTDISNVQIGQAVRVTTSAGATAGVTILQAQITTTGSTNYKIRITNGSAGIALPYINSGIITFNKISGFTPVSGTTVDTVSVNLTGSNLSIPVVNTDVIFNTLAFGNIPYNTSTGVFTLTANKTYELQATLKSRGTTAGYVQYEWVDGITAVAIVGGINGLDMQAPSILVEGSSSRAYLMYTPTTNQTVKVRVTGVAGTGIFLDAQRCNANIKQIGTSATTTTTRAMVKANTMSASASGGNGTAITFANEELDTTNSFNPTTGTFIAPRTSGYRISGQFFVGASNVSNGGRFGVILSTNGGGFGVGSPIISYFAALANPSSAVFGGSYIKSLNAGDSLTFRAFLDTAVSMSLAGNANFDYITIEEINNFY